MALILRSKLESLYETQGDSSGQTWSGWGVVMISSLPPDNTLWICDLCNGQIPVTDEYTLIPLIGSYALCIPCATTFPFWPDGWTQPRPRPCRCGACQRPVATVLARL